MYYGNCPIDVEKRIQEIREIPASTLKHRWTGALVCAFVIVDFLTIVVYLMSLFDDVPALAVLVAFALAAILDGCPSIAATILSSVSVNDTARDMRERKVQVGLLLGAAVAAFLIFCGFAVLSSMLSGSSATPTNGLSDLAGQITAQETDSAASLTMAANLIRMLIPLATSVGAFGFAFCPGQVRAAYLDKLKMQRLQLHDLRIDTEGAIGQYKYGLENYNADQMDYQNACYSLHNLVFAAERVRLECQALLAEELGSVEATNELLVRAGIEPLVNESELQRQLLPPEPTDKPSPAQVALGTVPESLDRATSEVKPGLSAQVAC